MWVVSCFSLVSTEFIPTPRPIPGPPFLASAILPLPGYQVFFLFSVLSLEGLGLRIFPTWALTSLHALCKVLTSESYCVADGGIDSGTFLSLQLP